ncbi:zona pellucida-binding protein 2 isoform X4 [Rhinoderma darwinii]|uniref:zona pellucida-binding protein 2 isoform X4 n=1 Tax=Rhinoderma darwinii TaxID=43563 RepID=UPI003F662BB1
MGRRCPLLSALCHLFALVFVVQVKSTEIHIPPLVTKHFIYGDLNHKVNVYVKMLKESPFLACMDLGIANEVTVDPFFLWVGPDGRNLKGHSNVNLTETGKLMLKAFEKSMSGSYSCTLSYKRIKNDVTQEREKYKSYEFAVFAYLHPDYMYQINVRYMAKPCSELANGRFVLTLLRIIREVISDLNCHLKNTYHKCHVIKAPKHSLQNELFIAFKGRRTSDLFPNSKSHYYSRKTEESTPFPVCGIKNVPARLMAVKRRPLYTWKRPKT